MAQELAKSLNLSNSNSKDQVGHEPRQPKRPRGRAAVWMAAAVVLMLLLGLGVRARRKSSPAKPPAGQGAGASQPGQPRPVPVAVAPVEQQDVPVYLSGLGNVQAFYTVTLRSRVDGQLLQVTVGEGQQVRKGQEVAVIDPRPFAATLAQAEATKLKDQSQYENARRDLARYQDLFRQGIVSQQQYNTQQALAGQYEGQVGADDAAIEKARLDVVYCHIKAPIEGRVGLRLVDPGNMVHPGDANGLMVITQLEPIAVLFTLPEDQLPAVSKPLRADVKLPVEAWSRDNTQKIAAGSLLTIDNEIDPTTGTFRLKSVFQNRDGALYPNQFVNARILTETRKGAITVPAAAIQRGAGGAFVYVVKPDSTVEKREVKVALTQELLAVVEGGLKPGEAVVTDGQDKLEPGSRVEARGGGQPAAAGAPAPANGSKPSASAPRSRTQGEAGSRKRPGL